MAQVSIQPEVSGSVGGQPVSKLQNNAMNSQMPVSKKQEKGKTVMSTEISGTIDKKSGDVKDKEENPKKKSHWWVWLIIILALIGAGVAAYFLILKDVISF